MCVAPLVRAPVRGQRAVDVALLLQQNPQIERAGRIAALVGATEGSRRAGEITLLR
jgi:hypothetical protein